MDHSREGRLLDRPHAMIAPPSEREQIVFLQHIQRVFDEGEFAATYKFALLVALTELAIEHGDDSGAPLQLELKAIAEKFIEQYWPHAAPYSSGQQKAKATVLVQNNGRQAALITLVAGMRDRFGTLAKARQDRRWAIFVKQAASIVEQMPLWKLQTLRRQNVLFLYANGLVNGCITLLPGVAFNLRRFSGLIQQLARSAWIQQIRANPRNALAIGQASDLETFLFGIARSNLAAAKHVLVELQRNRCFYCNGGLHARVDVDHFIPWSKYPRDLAHNLVLAHTMCNNDKRDLLAATAHLANWVERNRVHGEKLSRELAEIGIVSDFDSTVQVARWAYQQAEQVSAQLWLERERTVPIDRSYASLLA